MQKNRRENTKQFERGNAVLTGSLESAQIIRCNVREAVPCSYVVWNYSRFYNYLIFFKENTTEDLIITCFTSPSYIPTWPLWMIISSIYSPGWYHVNLSIISATRSIIWHHIPRKPASDTQTGIFTKSWLEYNAVFKWKHSNTVGFSPSFKCTIGIFVQMRVFPDASQVFTYWRMGWNLNIFDTLLCNKNS